MVPEKWRYANIRRLTSPHPLVAALGLSISLRSCIRSKICPRPTRFSTPRNPPNRRILKLFRVGDGIAELAVFVEATGQQVVKQASAHLLELRNHRLRLRNRLVYRVQYGGDAALFGRIGQRNRNSLKDFPR